MGRVRKRKTKFHSWLEEQNKDKSFVNEKSLYESVAIRFVGIFEGQRTYKWKCPSCEGNYSYSDKINAKWGHPEDKVFCAVCCKYYNFEEDVSEGLHQKRNL